MFAHRPLQTGSLSYASRRSRKRSRRGPLRSLGLESLEQRFLLSVAPLSDPVVPTSDDASVAEEVGSELEDDRFWSVQLGPGDDGSQQMPDGDQAASGDGQDEGQNDDGGSAPGEDTGGAAQPPGATPTPPTAVADVYDLLEDQVLVVEDDGLLANDFPASEGQLTAVLVAGPEHGELVLDADGTFSYTPDADFHGTDSFTYQDVSASLESDVVTVTLNVESVNDAPSITADMLWTSRSEIGEGEAVTVGGSFTDAEEGPHQVLVEWGDGTTTTLDLAAGVDEFEFAPHRYADDPPVAEDVCVVTVSVIDAENASAEAAVGVMVYNVAPDLEVVGDRIVGVGGRFTLDDLARFEDPGFGTETFLCSVDWGDGSVETVLPEIVEGGPEVPTTGSLGSDHQYDEAGLYTVSVTVADDDGGSTTRQFTIDARGDLVDFVVPTTGVLRVKCLGGSASAKSSFSIGKSPEKLRTVLRWLPRVTHEKAFGLVREGQSLHFAIKSVLDGRVAVASSGGNDFEDLEAFTDRNGDLGFGGAVIEQTAEHTWVLHLDDPVWNDDDDNDVQIQLRIQPVGHRPADGQPQEGERPDDRQRKRHRGRPQVEELLQRGRLGKAISTMKSAIESAVDRDEHRGDGGLFDRLGSRACHRRATDAALRDEDFAATEPEIARTVARAVAQFSARARLHGRG